MSIASEKVRQASERFLLVRFTPARFIDPDFISGSDYGMTFNFPISRITRNGVNITLVTALSGNNQYTYNEDTGALVIRLAGPPNDTTNVLVAYYHLFYTGTVFRSITQDPTDGTTTLRDWSPRITNYPSFTQSIDNIISGVFTINNTSITLINGDGDFQQYLTANDSFYNKQVDIWLCIDSEANIQKIFTGTVTSISLSQNTVSLQINDAFKQLQKPAFMGDDESECIYRREAGGFPSLDPNRNGVTVPYIIGSSSRYKTVFNADSATSYPGLKLINEATEAICVSYGASISTSTNRTWGCCRIKGAIATQSIASGVRSIDIGSYVFLFYTTLSNIVVGDGFQWANAGTKYGLVVHVGEFTYLANNYNIIIKTADELSHTHTTTNLKSFGVIVEQGGVQYQAISGRDYTVQETATSGGNIYAEIVFTNNFEANLSITALDPNLDKVLFRASNTNIQTHGEILQDMVEASGLITDGISFAAADLTLPVNCRFSIPNFDEGDFNTYLEYCQDVLKSSLGFLRLNSDFEVEYYLISVPSVGPARDKNLMLQDQSSIDVEYQDIATKIIAYNPHRENQEAIDDVSSPSVTASNAKSQYLNEFVNVDRFRHVLEEISSKIDDHINLKSMRRVKYTFATATEDIDSELGDDISLDNKIVLGDSNNQNVKVISIQKAPNKTVIEALDLEGL